MRLTCSATLSAGCDNARLVFGYQDPNNYWVKIYSKAQQKTLIYEINAGTWTQRSSASYTITAGTAFTMTAEVRAGQADTYAGTVLAGQVGLWCSHGTANSLDDFKVRDVAGPFEVDGKYFCSTGQVRTDDSDNNVLEAYGTDGLESCTIRRGFRGATYVATYKFKWNASSSPGWVVRWLSPGDYIVAYLDSTGGPNCYKREADGTLSSLTMGGSALNLTANTWYEAKVVVDDPNSDGAQRLRYWVDTDGDGDYADETVLINTTAVDDVWSAGHVGLYRAAGGSAAQQYDDVKIGYDNNADGDILDAGDDIQASDDFGSNVMSLSYDNNGNLTDDGVIRFVYDAWNRLRQAQRVAAGDTTTFGTYSYYADTRRAGKVVAHCGPEAVANDGGDQTATFYYGGVPGAAGGVTRWNIFETRNGSNQATRQWVWGTRYVDEVLFMDVNGDPAAGNLCDPDDPNAPEGTKRYFYHQDRNWNVVALTEGAGGVNGRIAERYSYTPYGEFVVLKANAGTGMLGNALLRSATENTLGSQGLPFDAESAQYQNRSREYGPARYAQRDPASQHEGTNSYLPYDAQPTVRRDPLGLYTQHFICEYCATLALSDPAVVPLRECANKVPPGRHFPCYGTTRCECCRDRNVAATYNTSPLSGNIVLCENNLPGAVIINGRIQCDSAYRENIIHELVHAIMYCRRRDPPLFNGLPLGGDACIRCLVLEVFAFNISGRCATIGSCLPLAEVACNRTGSCSPPATPQQMNDAKAILEAAQRSPGGLRGHIDTWCRDL